VLGLDLSEIVIIMVVALIVFGPEKLPEISREIGKFMGRTRRTVESLRREFYNEIYPPAQELGREFFDASRELRAVGQDLLNPTTPTSQSTPTAPTAPSIAPEPQNAADTSNKEEAK
jgi:sec-independent protein translocase protein TatB